MTLRRIGLCLLALTAIGISPGIVTAADWLHWRGPEQNGFSRETNLPDDWEPNKAGRDNLIWKVPVGCRSTPLVMNGRVYFINSFGDVPRTQTQAERLVTGERVMCLDAATGKTVWEKKFNVFLTDIVTNRLGWASPTADPVGNKIYVHTSAGFLLALNGDTGETVWEHQLTEEYGRVTGYGGRIASPVCDSGLVIVGMVQGSWGSFARGSHRFVAFDKDTGAVVWWSETTGDLKGTYYSNPIVATINGQRLLISGAADGSLYAFQVRTGKLVWSYRYSAGVINPSPVVVGNYVMCSHGEENAEGGDIGRVICLDASKVENGKPELVWQFRDGTRFGLASPGADDNYLYVPDDAGKLYCFDIKKTPVGSDKTNKFIWKYNYATLSRGSPLIADGKVYISGVDARFTIIKLNGKKAPDEAFETKFKAPPGGVGLVEVNCTPAVANGKVYFSTRDEFFCIGKDDWKPSKESVKPAAQEVSTGKVGSIQLVPADVVAKPGEVVKFTVRAYDTNGVQVKAELETIEWSLPLPAVAKAGAPQPPALDATIADGTLTLGKKPAQQGIVLMKSGAFTASARVRVAAGTTYKQDFEALTPGGAVGGWVNVQGKFTIAVKDGNKVLSKINNDPRPPLARAYAYITTPAATGYTIEADVMGVEKKNALPDAGLLANRYTLYLDGKTNEKGERFARLISWEALPRIDVQVPYTWKSGVWYRMKLTVEVGETEALVRGKVWEKDQPEPSGWTVEFKDPLPNRVGAAALYGYVTNADKDAPGSEIFYDNVLVTPNSKK
jgi:outer membrane protein assembly factor BamB